MNSFSNTLLKWTLLVTIMLAAGNTPAQENYSAYFHTITKKGYEGLRFRYKAFVRTAIEDADALGLLYLKVDRNGEPGFFKSTDNQPSATTAWQELSIEGRFDADYSQIIIGFLTIYNGKFYLDDVYIEVETKDKKWKPIYKNGFEQNTDSWKQGFEKEGTDTNYLYQAQLSAENPKSGRQCFSVTGAGVPNYGTNSKAGNYADINGMKLYYEIYGTGKPLVILHGNGGSIASAGEHLPFFAQSYKVIAVDSRGQGKSIDNESELTYELMAADINGLLDELKIDSAYVWGHSDGAILAIVLALNHAEKVKKAVAFAANVVTDTIGIEAPIFRWIEDKARHTADKKQKQLTTLMWKHPAISPTRLQAITAEFLIMSGDRDFVPLLHTLDIFKNIPNSNLCIIPGATHGAAWKKPKLFQELVLDFFERPFIKPATIDRFR